MRFYQDESILGWDFTATRPFWGEILPKQGHSRVRFYSNKAILGLTSSPSCLILDLVAFIFSLCLMSSPETFTSKKKQHTIRHLSFKQNSLIYLYFFILNTFTCNSIFWRNTIGIKSTKLLKENLYLLIIDCSMKYLNVQIMKFS